jgi:ATP-grasp domain
MEQAPAVPRVLLTATLRWPNSALLAVPLARAGSEVSAACPAHHPLLKTRAVRRTFHYGGLRPLASLSSAIEDTQPHLIVPCDELAVQHLHELHARAASLGALGSAITVLIERSLGLPDSYPTVLARHQLLRIAQEEGIRVPDMEEIHAEGDLRSWQSQHTFPWVLKVDGTGAGLGVKVVHGPQQARRSLVKLTRYYTFWRAIKRLLVDKDEFWLRPWWKGVAPQVSVQSYVRGRPGNCAVVCWKGEVLSCICVEVIGAAGESGPANLVRVVDHLDMVTAAERIARRLGLSGFLGLDFMIDEASGTAYLIELNPRATRPCHLQLGKGRDLIGALYGKLVGQPGPEVPPVTTKRLIAYFPDALSRGDDLLKSSFQDTPEGEPELIQELLQPWPPRGLLWHLVDSMYRLNC